MRWRLAGPQLSLHPTPRKALNADMLQAMLARSGGSNSTTGIVVFVPSPPAPGGVSPADLTVAERSRFMGGLAPLCRNFVESAGHLSRELQKEMEGLLGALSVARRETISHREHEQVAITALATLRAEARARTSSEAAVAHLGQLQRLREERDRTTATLLLFVCPFLLFFAYRPSRVFEQDWWNALPRLTRRCKARTGRGRPLELLSVWPPKGSRCLSSLRPHW